MRVMSSTLVTEAKEKAKKMLKSSDEILALNFGESKNSVFVTTNDSLLTAVTEYFELEGKIFYIGWGLKQNNEIDSELIINEIKKRAEDLGFEANIEIMDIEDFIEQNKDT